MSSQITHLWANDPGACPAADAGCLLLNLGLRTSCHVAAQRPVGTGAGQPRPRLRGLCDLGPGSSRGQGWGPSGIGGLGPGGGRRDPCSPQVSLGLPSSALLPWDLCGLSTQPAQGTDTLPLRQLYSRRSARAAPQEMNRLGARTQLGVPAKERTWGTEPRMPRPRRRTEEALTAHVLLSGKHGGRPAPAARPPPGSGPGSGSRAAVGSLFGLEPRPLRRGREEEAVLRPQASDGTRRGWRPSPAGKPRPRPASGVREPRPPAQASPGFSGPCFA